MSKVIVTESYLENIGDAIRAKLGGSDTYKPSEMAGAISQIHGEPVLEALSVTENGTYDPSSGKDGFSQAIVNVPNTYAAGDEGKVVSNGALVAQTSDTVTENDTYDTTLINQLTVNVSGGGGGNPYEDAAIVEDYKKYGSRTENNVTFSSQGATFDAAGDYLSIPIKTNNITVYIDIKSMQLTSGTHRRFIMGSATNGFIYRSSGVWAFYANSWQDTELTDPNLFDNSTIKIYIDTNNKWHIYKNEVLIFEPTIALAISDFMIGSSSGQSINNAIIEILRVYDGYYTETL